VDAAAVKLWWIFKARWRRPRVMSLSKYPVPFLMTVRPVVAFGPARRANHGEQFVNKSYPIVLIASPVESLGCFSESRQDNRHDDQHKRRDLTEPSPPSGEKPNYRSIKSMVFEWPCQVLPSRSNSRKSIFAKYNGVKSPFSGASLVDPTTDLTTTFFFPPVWRPPTMIL
jgi:hypothetical protein